jgi:hypothetical protein
LADIIDQAGDLEMQNTARALAEHRQRAALVKRPAPTGYCLTCFEEFATNDNQRLFCGAKCAQAHR